MNNIASGDFVIYRTNVESLFGRVKSVDIPNGISFVVFNCAGEWDKYKDYTGQHTYTDKLTALKEFTEYHNSLHERIKNLSNEEIEKT